MSDSTTKTFSVMAMGHDGEAFVPCRVELTESDGIGLHVHSPLADSAVRELLLRVTTALMYGSGVNLPGKKITITISGPEAFLSDRKRSKSFLALPIAVVLLIAAGRIPARPAEDLAYCGNLKINGDLTEEGCSDVRHMRDCPVPVLVPGSGWPEKEYPNLHSSRTLRSLITAFQCAEILGTSYSGERISF